MGVLFQEPMLPLRWTYAWLALGGLMFVLAALAFLYLVVKRRWAWLSRGLRHPALLRMDRTLARRLPRLWAFIRQRFTPTEWHGLALTVAAGITFGALYLFALITESWTDQEVLYAFDQQVSRWLASSMHPGVYALMERITFLGDGAAITTLSVIVGLVLLARRDAWHLITLVLGPGVGSWLVEVLKDFFDRTRPDSLLAASLGHSFPSGHAFAAMAFYGFLIYLTWRLTDRDPVRIGVTILLALLIVLIGLSRVVLRVHWVSDVAGGCTLALAWLVGCIVFTRVLRALVTGRRRA